MPGEKLKKIILILGIFLIFLLFLVFFNFSFKNQQSTAKQNTATTSVKQIFSPPKLTLESIFNSKKTDFSKASSEKIVTLIATGDVIPARGVNWAVVAKKDFTYPFQKTADFLKSGDITLINLEAPLIKNCPLLSTGFTFCGDQRHVEGLKFAGIDVASIANNHIGNFGTIGIQQTKELLDSNAILWSGFSNLAIKEIRGMKFGFLAYNGVGSSINREALKTEIVEAKKKVDVLVVSIHWGEEYVAIPDDEPGIAPDEPIEIGHLLIDSGADLIIGNHPHWVQAIEIYKEKFIAYAHGNFIFDQTWSTETQEGVVGEYTFYDGRLAAVHFTPIVVDKSYQPVFVEGSRAELILERMRSASQSIK